VASEIERKFLVAQLPDDLDRHPSESIDQGYLTGSGEDPEIRLRRRGERTVLTIKAGSGRTRQEEEIDLDGERFARLWPLTEGRQLRKRRHSIPLDSDLIAELDVYRDSLDGLEVVEVEFPSEQDADAFVAPAWFGAEVTGDERFSNRELAQRGRPPS
jgi:adenylate cyclase